MVLTVPASFDASARELTREAALAAGLPDGLVLLEEPQAAVYAWLAAAGNRWRRALSVGDTLLVCDVGGGTTDLTLVGADEENGELVLRRIAVGNHLLVGGDNMDLALAHHVAGLFAQRGTKLDPWQSVALWHSCRAAKETLLGAGRPADAHDLGARPRPKLDRRHGLGRGRSPERRPTAGRWVPAALPAGRSADAAPGVGLPRAGPALRDGHGDYPAPGRLPATARRRARPGRRGRRTCS